MGSHAKTRTTGRKTALGALAVGATLTGVGLTAAALDPATAVLSAGSAPGAGAAIQLSGLADPVAISPQTSTLTALTAAPATSTVGSAASSAGSTGKAVRGTVHQVTSAIAARSGGSVPDAATSTSRPVLSTPEQSSTPAAAGSGQSAIRPIQQGSGALTSGYTGKHRQARSAPTPTDDGQLTDLLGSDSLPDPLSGLLGAGSNPLSGLLGSGDSTALLGAVPLLGGL
ncbi:hypothetical protein [Actinospica robiniae]|uniref:hypothetical protein n=1 Tax=Actinospica robiniae TaxID=304901 RepID=UPI00041D6721|nr:hypothetical protein [Actinospica robiniae]